MSNPNSPSKDELEVAEAKNPLLDLVYDYAAEALTNRIGNFVYQRLDSILSTIEKTAKWSLPPKENTGKSTISAPPLVRPLPWILFLPALLALRLLRYFLSFVALLMGHQPVYPVTMVSYLQNKRRKLRAFKYRGLRLQRIRRAEMESKEEDEQRLSNSWFQRITRPLRYVVCLRAFRPVPSNRAWDHHDCRYRRNEQSAEKADESAPNGPQGCCLFSHKRNAHERDSDDSENSLDEESVDQLLDKYAHLEGDSSYQPSEITDFDSDSMNSDKSSTGTVEEAKTNDTEKIGTENGHAATNGKDSQSTTESSPKSEESPKVEKPKKAKKSQKTEKPHEVKKTQETGKSQTADEPKKTEKPHDARQKSLLNAVETNGKTKEKPVEPAPENGTAASEEEKEPKEEKSAEASQKPVADENTATENKPAVESNPEHPSEEVAQKLFEAISNQYQQYQLNLDQQQQHQLQEPHYQHRPQQSHTAVNGGGGGDGKMHKKRHHHNAHHHH